MSGSETKRSGLTRRGFLKATGVASLGVAGAGSLGFGGHALFANAQEEADRDGEEIVSTICSANCFQACMLNAHVRDGKVVKMSRGDYPEEIYSGCCLRGLSIPERTYSDNRLKYPLKRVEGTDRGAGEWERISWDQAIDEITTKLKEIREEYGPRAVTWSFSSGNYRGQEAATIRLAFTVGGCFLQLMYDYAIGWGTNRVIGGGTFGYSNEPKDMVNSKYIIVWGTNPVLTTPQTWRIILQAKDNGAKLLCIDPMRSATSHYCDEWIQIKQGTDLYLALAILNEIVREDRIDVEYVKRATTAPFLIRQDTGLFLRRSDIEGGELTDVRDAVTLNTAGSTKADPAYVIDEATGDIAFYTECDTPVLEGEFEVQGIKVKTAYSALKEHMAAYTVEDASELSGVPVETIRELVDIYTSGEPVMAYTQFGIDHYRGSHLWGQTLAIIAALTNNLSRHGSGLGGPGCPKGALSPLYVNPAVSMGVSPVDIANMDPRLCSAAWLEAVRTGKYCGEDYPIKAFVGQTGNPASNYPQQRSWLEDVVGNLDLIVTTDIEMTDTARYSDYVLPASFWLEYPDLRGNFSNPYLVYGGKAIEPLWECKNDSEITTLIAHGLGYEEHYPYFTDEEWIDIGLDSDGNRARGIDHATLKEKKAIRQLGTEEEPWMVGGFEYDNEFPTPSGRAEIYCEIPTACYEYGQDWQSEAKEQQFPIWLPPFENWPGAEIRSKYPLGFLQLHQRWRTHSQWFASETLREIDKEPLLHISRPDADKRGIASGDVVEVFNDRGRCVVKTVVDDALPEALCYIPKGWQRSQFIEGGYQELTANRADACAGSYVYYDTAVEVKKVEE